MPDIIAKPAASGGDAARAHDEVPEPPMSFAWPVRVYYEDTDAGGVVYYANYLRFFERCRTEWLRALGFDHHALAARESVLFVVAAAEIEYLRPARLDDALRIEAAVAQQQGSYVVFAHCARRAEEPLCRARVKVACVDTATLRPRRVPAALAEAFARISPTTPAAGRPTSTSDIE